MLEVVNHNLNATLPDMLDVCCWITQKELQAVLGVNILTQPLVVERWTTINGRTADARRT